MTRLRLAVQGRDRFAGLPAPATLRRWVAAALARDGAITVRFVGAAEGLRLNRDFRHRDYATNVLTFAYARAPAVCADIVLCVPVIRTEAREQGKSFRDHLAHLVVHGSLHALGYDHGASAAARIMEAREVRILQSLAVKNPYQPQITAHAAGRSPARTRGRGAR